MRVYRFFLILLFLTFSLSCVSTSQSRKPSNEHNKKFAELVNRFREISHPLVPKKLSYELSFEKGDSGAVFSTSDPYKYKMIIGTEAYDPALGTYDVFLMLLCHELGHVAKSTIDSENRSSVSSEFKADYWTTSVCAPYVFKYFEQQTNLATPIDSSINQSCAKKYSKESEQILCHRIISAAYEFRKTAPTDRFTFVDNFEELSCTEGFGDYKPHKLQCGFNHMVAGALKINPPACFNELIYGNMSNLNGFEGPEYLRFYTSEERKLKNPSKEDFFRDQCLAIKSKTFKNRINLENKHLFK